jgi:hypothetical protein
MPLPPWRQSFRDRERQREVIEGDPIGGDAHRPLAPKREGNQSMGIAIGFDYNEPDYVLSRTVDAVVARATRTDPPESARHFMGHADFPHLAHASLRAVGRAAGGDPYSNKRGAGAELIRLALTDSDLPLHTGEVIRKIAQLTFERLRPPYREIAAQRNFADYKEHQVLRLADFPAPKRVGPGGEIQHGALSESGGERVTAARYARTVTLAMETMVNGDIDALGNLGRAAIQSVEDLRDALLFDLLLSNPTMEDLEQLFSIAHGNLAGSGAVISTTSVGAARAAIMSQTSPDGMKSVAIPRLLVCPPAIATLAEETLAKLALGTDPAWRMRVLPAANLSGTGWYVFTAPDELESMIYASVGGDGGMPSIIGKKSFLRDGIDFLVATSFVAAAVDWRGVYKNPGA